MLDLSQTFQDWQIFYATIAGVTATLLGLLFVAISINLDVFSGKDLHYKRLARLTLGKFLNMLIVSLVFLFPHQSAHGVGITIVIVCGLGAWDTLNYILQARTLENNTYSTIHLLPLITYLALTGFAILLMIRFDTTWLHWLGAAVIVMLISASRHAWELMVKFPKA